MNGIRDVMILAVTVYLMMACSNERAGEDVIRSYESQKGVVTFRLPPSLVGRMIGREDPEIQDMFQNMESVKFILVDLKKAGAASNTEFTREFEERLKSLGFETLFMTNQEGQAIHVLSLEEEENQVLIIKEIMILLTGQNEFLGLSVSGDIDPDIMVKAAKEMQLGDFEFE
jgi:hypothetical protein